MKLCFHWNHQWELFIFLLFCTPNKVQETGDIVISDAYVDLTPALAILAEIPSEVRYQNWYLSHFLISELQLRLL